MGPNWNRLANTGYNILSDIVERHETQLNAEQLTALDAQLEVMNAMHNNILGASHFGLATEQRAAVTAFV